MKRFQGCVLTVLSYLLPISLAAATASNRTHVVNVNLDGSFTPARVDVFSGDTVEWHFPSGTDAILPISLDASGHADCTSFRPYAPNDPNEFTGPMPRAVAGVFSLSPEDSPYASQDATWQSTNLTGVFIRMRWDDVHLGPGQFNWQELDQEIEKAVLHGKLYSLGFKAGSRGTPQWIFNPAKTDASVVPLDFGFKQGGKPVYLGSPADANYRKHYSDLLGAVASHLRERNAFYRALAYIKICGLNLVTHENRLPNDTTQDLGTWAGAGHYTPTALLEFYHLETAFLATNFPGKDMSYALIQDGFPTINDHGEFQGQAVPPQFSLPGGADQTGAVLSQGRLEQGLHFVVQHNGLQTKPSFCPGEGVHPVALDPNFHYVGSGCPNRWVLEQAAAGQVTGFQIVAGITNLIDLESTLQNEWDNSDGFFIEIYEGNARQAEATGLPSGVTLGTWGERFHQRRLANFPSIPDPFSTTYRYTFTRTLASGSDAQLLYYLDPVRCPSLGGSTTYGTVAILPDLSFTSISVQPDKTIQLVLSVARPGTIQFETSGDLSQWTLLKTMDTAGGTVQVLVTPAQSASTFYRAALTGH